MQVKNCSVLEVREYKNRTFLCQLRIVPGPVVDTQRSSLLYRWLENKHWERLDDELERILDGVFDHRFKLDEYQEFNIDAEVRVKVQPSQTPVDVLLRCIDDGQLSKKQIALALECVLEVVKWSDPDSGSVKDLFAYSGSDSEYNPQRACSPTGSYHTSYIPYKPTEKNVLDDSIESAKQREEVYSPAPLLELSPELQVKPSYTPSPIKRRTRATVAAENILNTSSELENEIDTERKAIKGKKANSMRRRKSKQDAAKETQSQKHKSEEMEKLFVNYEVSQSFSPLKDEEEIESDFTTMSEGHFNESRRELHNVNFKKIVKDSKQEEAEHSPSIDNKKNAYINSPREKNVVIEIPSSSERSSDRKAKQAAEPKIRNDVRLKSTTEKTEKSKNFKEFDSVESDDSPRKEQYEPQMQEQNTELHMSSRSEKCPNLLSSADGLRRSIRSPIKPKRLIHEIGSERKPLHKKLPTTSCKKHKKLNRMKDMFGSDTDGDDFVVEKPKAPTPKALHSSAKKRKQENKNDCTYEKHSISNWLGKKESQERKRKNECFAKTTAEVVPALSLPSKEEMAERLNREKVQIERNKEIQEMLQGLIESKKPKEVEILSLDNMSIKDLLATFIKHKPMLDKIFTKLHKKPNVSSHNGINHYVVIDLINTDKQLQMMHKLGEVYESDNTGISLYTQLFANVMMPEWVLSIFKDKFNFTHDEAMKQLKKQRDYKLYLECQDK